MARRDGQLSEHSEKVGTVILATMARGHTTLMKAKARLTTSLEMPSIPEIGTLVSCILEDRDTYIVSRRSVFYDSWLLGVEAVTSTDGLTSLLYEERITTPFVPYPTDYRRICLPESWIPEKDQSIVSGRAIIIATSTSLKHPSGEPQPAIRHRGGRSMWQYFLVLRRHVEFQD